MRKIDEIIIHCTATPAGREVSVEQLRRYHVEHNGWADIGYHYVVGLDGTVHRGRPVEQAGAHCKGHNARSIGIAYVGGLLPDNRTPADTRTEEQKQALEKLIKDLLKKFPGSRVHSHRDFAPKACPCFNATAEYRSLLTGLMIAMIMPLLTACHTQRQIASASTEEMTISRAIKMIKNTEANDTSALRLTITLDSMVMTHRDSAGSFTSLTAPRATLRLRHSAAGRRTVSVEVADTIVSTSSGTASSTTRSTARSGCRYRAAIGIFLLSVSMLLVTVLSKMKTKR